jgi:hypothetical protein
MSQAGRHILVAGLVLAAVGALIWGLGKLGFKGLPGDLKIDSGRMTIYFPIVTCLALSVLLTALVWLVQLLRR